MDEADLLADTIAVLAAPGKLVAQGTPVALKSSLGEGYTVDVAFDVVGSSEKSATPSSTELLDRIRSLAPSTYVTSSSPTQAAYHLKVKDSSTVQRILQMIEDEKMVYNVASYSVLGTSIEDIFLNLMHDSSTKEESEQREVEDDKSHSSSPSLPTLPQPMSLSSGRRRTPLSQAFTIFHKRFLIFRRSWLTPFLAILVAVAGCCVPLFFLSDVKDSCAQHVRKNVTVVPLFLPFSPIGTLEEMVTGDRILASPPGITATLGTAATGLMVQDIPDNTTFVNTIQQTFLNQSLGGVSVDLQSNTALFAWEATPPGLTGQVMLNFVSNILYTNALNSTGTAVSAPSLIAANYSSFPGLAAGTLSALRWIAFFGASMVSSAPYPLPVHSHTVRYHSLSSQRSSLSMYPRNDALPCKPCNFPTVSPTQLDCGLDTSSSTQSPASSQQRSLSLFSLAPHHTISMALAFL